MTLSQKQQDFSTMVGKLLVWVSASQHYGVTFAEAYRPPDVAALYAKEGRGIKRSLHCQRLAVDLNLFIDGAYQTSSDAYEPLGVFWETLGGAWGGRFRNRDGNHFSLAHGGRK
jgi:hypothetical protein